MSRQTDQLRQLARLTAAEFDSRQVRMGRLRAKADDVRARLRAIEEDRRRQLDGLDAGDVFVTSGAALEWQRWIDGRRSALNLELARILAQIEEERPALATSFGRDHALRELIERQRKSERQQASRRE